MILNLSRRKKIKIFTFDFNNNVKFIPIKNPLIIHIIFYIDINNMDPSERAQPLAKG